MNAFKPLVWRRHAILALLATLFVTACGLLPEKPVETVSPEVQAAPVRDMADIRRIEVLEWQVYELQKQLLDQRRQYLDIRRKLERDLKESQDRLDEVQTKLEAILTIDRDLRRMNKATE